MAVSVSSGSFLSRIISLLSEDSRVTQVHFLFALEADDRPGLTLVAERQARRFDIASERTKASVLRVQAPSVAPVAPQGWRHQAQSS